MINECLRNEQGRLITHEENKKGSPTQRAFLNLLRKHFLFNARGNSLVAAERD